MAGLLSFSLPVSDLTRMWDLEAVRVQHKWSCSAFSLSGNKRT